MVSFQVKRLHNATEAQIREIVDFFTDAFYGNIAMNAVLGGDWSLLREMEFATLRAVLLEGFVYIVTIGRGTDEKIVSAGYWLYGHTGLFTSEQQRALGYNEVYERLSVETKAWTNETFALKMSELRRTFLTKEELAKRWWCSNLATHPEHQGKGYATAIVNAMFKKAKAEGTFIGLIATEKEVLEKYLSMGFKLRGKGLMPSPTGDFPLYFLVMGSLA